MSELKESFPIVGLTRPTRTYNLKVVEEIGTNQVDITLQFDPPAKESEKSARMYVADIVMSALVDAGIMTESREIQ